MFRILRTWSSISVQHVLFGKLGWLLGLEQGSHSADMHQYRVNTEMLLIVVPPYSGGMCSQSPRGRLKPQTVLNSIDTMCFPIHITHTHDKA